MNRARSFLGVVILFLFLIVGVWGMWWFRAPQNNQYSDPSAQYYKDLEQRYAEDTYGGSTPEETLNLFIAALESGNIDLASKYFVVEKQEEKRNDFLKGKENNTLETFIEILSLPKNGKELFNKNFQFVIADQNHEALLTIDLVKIPNGKWKIVGL